MTIFKFRVLSTRIFTLILVISILALTLASCNEGNSDDPDGSGASAGGSSSNPVKLSDNATGAINGKEISKSQFDAKVDSEIATYSSGGIEITDELRRETKRGVFARMASDTIILMKAEEQGVAISKEAAKADVDKVIERVGGEDALLAFLGNMGGGIKTVDEFIEWKRLELSREALIDKVGEGVEVDEAALKAEFDGLMAEYEKARNEGRPAMMPGGSFEDYLERRKLQAKLVRFDEYIDAALTTAKVVVTDPDLEGAIDEYIKMSSDEAMSGMNPHGGVSMGGAPQSDTDSGGESGGGADDSKDIGSAHG